MRAETRRSGWIPKALISGVVLSAASAASASVVTFHLSYNDDGAGNPTPGSFAVYATDTSDNFGIFALGVDLSGSIDSIFNMLPQVQYRKTGSSTKFAGFSAGVTEDAAAGKLSGLPDLAKGTNLIPVYGFGQQDGNLCPGIGIYPQPVGYGSCTDTNPNGPGFLYKAKFLVGIGTFSGARPHFETTSVDNKASVYTANGGSTSSAVVQVVFDEGPGIEQDTVTLTSAAGDTNQAVGGSIAVTGGNRSYVSEVDQLLNNVSHGSAPIQTIGDETGKVYVMAKLLGADQDVAAVVSALGVGATDSEFAPLHANYDSQFGPGGFNALFKFDNMAGPKVFNWNFLLHSGVTIDQLAAVPEPGMIGLISLTVTGLGMRRRK